VISLRYHYHPKAVFFNITYQFIDVLIFQFVSLLIYLLIINISRFAHSGITDNESFKGGDAIQK
ncbi:hypothetical protein, partial [Capnocytophaga sputigena]|uniref:hypothetical protein n=1 Tax=Capnocytophaga sputigena TaxID=1019 RepID=UPI0028E91E5F